MSEPILQPASTVAPVKTDSEEETRRKAAKEVSNMAGLAALFCIGGLALFPSWPMAVGVVAVSAMVASTSYFINNGKA